MTSLSIKNSEELMELNSELSSLRDQLESYKKRVKIERTEEKEVKNRLQLELSELKIQVSGLEFEVSQRGKALSNLEKDNKVMVGENKQLSQFIQEYTTSKEKEIQQINKAYTDQILALKTKIKSLEDDLSDLLAKGQQKALESEQTLEGIKKVQSQVIDKLKDDNSQFVRSIEEMREKQLQTDETLYAKMQEIIKHQSKIDQLTGESSNLSRSLLSLQSELERVNELITAAELSIREKDHQINQMTYERSDIHKSLLKSQEQQEDLERLIRTLTQYKTTATNLEIENGQIKSQLQAANNELSLLRVKIHQSQNQVANSQVFPMSSANTYTSMVSQPSLQEQMLRRDLEEARKYAITSANEMASLRYQLNQRQSELDMMGGECSTLASRLASYSSQEPSQLNKINNLEDKIRLLQSELIRKNEECETYKTQASEFRATAEELVDDFKESQMFSNTLKSQNSFIKEASEELSSVRNQNADLQKELNKRIEHNRKLAVAFEKQRGELLKVTEQQKETQVELAVLREEFSKQKSKPSKQEKPESKKPSDAKKPVK